MRSFSRAPTSRRMLSNFVALVASLLVISAATACQPIPVVALDAGGGQLAVGDTLRIGAVFGHHSQMLIFHNEISFTSRTQPDEFRWTSSDSTVASVDRFGLVRALRVGATRITAEHNGVYASNPAVVTVVP
ncbi:MAG TPA: Ig-like domain-containing protein [Gemmatimonadaceae bacterium]|nr:Ig-like domain-containing protein [Gemmatimonadaceae bacterium]